MKTKSQRQTLVPFLDLESGHWFVIESSKLKDGATFDISEAIEIDEKRTCRLGVQPSGQTLDSRENCCIQAPRQFACEAFEHLKAYASRANRVYGRETSSWSVPCAPLERR